MSAPNESVVLNIDRSRSRPYYYFKVGNRVLWVALNILNPVWGHCDLACVVSVLKAMHAMNGDRPQVVEQNVHRVLLLWEEWKDVACIFQTSPLEYNHHDTSFNDWHPEMMDMFDLPPAEWKARHDAYNERRAAYDAL